MTRIMDKHQVAESISVSAALDTAFSALFKNFVSATKLAFLPAITLAILGTITASVFGLTVLEDISVISQEQPAASPYLWILEIAIMIVSFFIITQYFTAWTRFLKTGEHKIKSTLLIFPEKRQLIACLKGGGIIILSYIVLFLGITLITFSVLSLGGGIPFFVMFFALTIAWATILLRLLYVVPAAALDEPYGISDSWNQTKSQSFKLFISFFSLTVIYIIFTLILTAVIAGILSIFDFSILDTLSSGDLSGIINNPNFIWIYFGFNLVTIFVSILFYTPYMNMYLYCFKTNTGWQHHEEIAETFS